MADPGGGGGSPSVPGGSVFTGSSPGIPGNTTSNAELDSTSNTQMINEVSAMGGGTQATKMVGWNAVPSGFEPLPRSIGGRKLAYQLSNFSGGLNKKTSARDIALSECTRAENVSFSNQGRITVLGDAK